MNKKNFSYKNVIRYAAILLVFICFNKITDTYAPFAITALVGVLYVGANPYFSCALYIISFIPSLSLRTILCESIAAIFLCVIFAVYRSHKRKPKFEMIIYNAAAVCPYVLADLTLTILQRTIYASIICITVFIMISAARVFMIKGLRYKISLDEFICAAAAVVLTGLGAVRLTGESSWKCLGIFAILLTATLYPNNGTACVTAGIFAAPLALTEMSLNPIAIFLIYSFVILIFTGYSRLLSCIAVTGIEMAMYYFTDIYTSYSLINALFILIPIVLYLFIPNAYINKLKDKLYMFRENHLPRFAINRTRNQLSGKLYEISSVFDEMKNSITKLNEKTLNEDDYKDKMCSEVLFTVCANCSAFNKCRSNNFPDKNEIYKIINIGIAKGKINLIDLPGSFQDNCAYSNSIIFEVNRLIKEYQLKIEEINGLDSGRELIGLQNGGLAEVLRGLAFDMSKTLVYYNKVENKIADNLFKCGIPVNEVMVLGEGNDKEVDIVLPVESAENKYFISAVSEILGDKYIITSKTNLTPEIAITALKCAPKLDAVFGIAAATKADKTLSGDTHSVMKLNENKFLLCLNDGMGSGKNAEDASETAISLIETFYKAGLSSELILSTVNKILTLNSDECFTAMDIGIVDLFSGSADFIKIGSPYSFIILDDGVKIIEGSSLPLGILDEMRPSVSRTNLKSGDIIVFFSDGISDAFSSSSDMIDFLSSERLYNPKALSDRILERAIFLSGGKPKDDMTVLAVRIFEKEAS